MIRTANQPIPPRTEAATVTTLPTSDAFEAHQEIP